MLKLWADHPLEMTLWMLINSFMTGVSSGIWKLILGN